ncbi:hypothetical protein GGR28_003368 [Lewinella aquimaris]|uniref:Uncharacterized protein n=1 Tax=Neolewinella aquimaris TaxID=1835722 RepID=A0A840E9W3_9BACT|nr:hypothetical protein [Neolewinella aquimaris]MBB4080733.1 hypothetical protein [Neolewinella aquimaris]
MKYLLLAGLLSLTFACDNGTTTTEETTGTDQEVMPGGEVATEPVSPETTLGVETGTDLASHFDIALSDFDQAHYADAADHLRMGISALETAGVNLEDEAHEELKVVIEEMEDVTDRVRAGEVTDRSEIETLVERANMIVTPIEE